ncbi:hypothetical protein [Myceligenerans indicum]|uniref:SMI1/KNR4 family protein n=1 Tax=Myceligenerans indicum TaxID=2593663 RepID=A0ABS1LPV7_9MICO|nr:hypothetical protein [Myceligenerans indicum]MBL0888311.1 SMI1/KNR4 family protein [Myceligenerans indicum]
MTEVGEFDLAAEAAVAGLDREAAWRFVARFARHWLGAALDGESGVEEPRIVEAEQRLGLSFPAAVCELYALAGRRRDLWSNQDELLSIGKLYVQDGVLVVRHENQGVAIWGVRIEDLHLPDPPVVVHVDRFEPSDQWWEPWTASFTEAVAHWLVFESLWRDASVASFADDLDADDLEDLLARAVPVDLAQPSDGPVTARWLLVDDVVVLEAGTVMFTARSAEAAAAFRNRYRADWFDE